MVGRLPGIVTTAPVGATGPLTGMAALALATLAVASTFALAFAAAVVLAEVCFCNLSSFCSSRRSCCRSSAISWSLPPDSACAYEASISPIRLTAVATPDFVLDMRASPYHPGSSSPPCARSRHFPIAARARDAIEKIPAITPDVGSSKSSTMLATIYAPWATRPEPAAPRAKRTFGCCIEATRFPIKRL